MQAANRESVEIVVNGEARQVPAGSTVESLLHLLGIPAERVAVELNREIVRKAEWAATPLNSGANVEVVHFVGGG